MNVPAEILRQYEALTAGVGLAELDDHTRLELTGADRASFLNNLCTNDIKRLVPGSGCEAFFTNVKGKVLGHGMVFCRDQSLVIETVPGQAQLLLDHLDRYLIREDVQLHDRGQEWGELLLSGSGLPAWLQETFGVGLPAELLAHGPAPVAGATVWIARVELTGPTSLLILGSAEQIAPLSAHWQDRGAVACGPEAIEMARLEAGWPLYGQDIRDDNLPQEVDRNERAISFTKGCYLGQETVARLDALGHVNRTLVRLKFHGGQLPAAGTELTASDNTGKEKTVGTVTSAAWSPRLQAPLALGYVRRGHTQLRSPAGEAEVVAGSG